jgi:hypothetical protein
MLSFPYMKKNIGELVFKVDLDPTLIERLYVLFNKHFQTEI